MKLSFTHDALEEIAHRAIERKCGARGLKAIMEEFLSPSFALVHMSGQNQPKEGFVKEVIDGTLNYFKAGIINPTIEIKNNIADMKVDVAFDAKVYGMSGSWTLHSKTKFEKINNKWYFLNWNTRN